jgi:hypothetical protein
MNSDFSLKFIAGKTFFLCVPCVLKRKWVRDKQLSSICLRMSVAKIACQLEGLLA